MATSGSTDFTLTARQIVDFAGSKLQVVDVQGALDAANAAKFKRELNLMLKGWQKYPSLWRLAEGSVTLVASTASYTLSPEPHEVISARFDNQDTETPMFMMSRERYFDLPVKTSTGIPTQFYVDYQRAAATMYIWPLMSSVTDETINYTYRRKFEDIDDLANNIDIGDEYLEVVGYNLARRLLPDYGKTGEVAADIRQQATDLLNAMLDDDREDVEFVPGYEC